MRNFARNALVGLSLAAGLSFAGAALAQQPIVVKFSHVVAPDTPKGNILVVGVNADGTLAGTATTDAAGKATLTIREGATVTAIYPEDAFIDNTIT